MSVFQALRIAVVGALALVFAVLGSEPVHACACDPDERWSPELATLRSVRIVLGRIVQTEGTRAEVQVETYLAGGGPERLEFDNRFLFGVCCGLRAHSLSNEGSTDLRFRIGDRVLLYLDRSGQPSLTASGVVGEGFYRVEGRRLLRAGCLAGFLGSHRRRIARQLASPDLPPMRNQWKCQRLRKRRCGRARRPENRRF